MRILFAILFAASLGHSPAQITRSLMMNGVAFVPDSLYMAPGDSVHVVFDTLGHSMIQVPEDSWMNEVPAPHIGIALGEGTPNVGLEHTFVIDSMVTIYYLCEQHPNEKGIIFVDDAFIGIEEKVLPGFTLYPHPASDVLNVGTANGHSGIRIDDHRGSQIHSVRSRNSMIDISHIPVGLYFITLLDDADKPIAREKLIISR